MTVKTALDLVGGGAKGIITCGALKYIVQQKVHYDAVFATSSGALNAAILATGDIDLLEHLWLNISNKDVRKLAPWKLLTPEACLYDSTPLYKTLQKYVDVDKIRKNPIPHVITLTDYKLTEVAHIDIRHEIDKSKLCKYLLASASIPLLFPPVLGRYYDGGVMDDYNAGHALSLWFERNIVIHPSRPSPFTIKGYQEAIEALTTCMGWATWLAMKERFAKNQANLIEIIPEHPIQLGVLDFDYKGHDRHELIKYGYDMAKAKLEGGQHERIGGFSTVNPAPAPKAGTVGNLGDNPASLRCQPGCVSHVQQPE